MSSILRDDTQYETSLGDVWNKHIPFESLRIGNTTNVDGKKFDHRNKRFNNQTLEELDSRFLDRTQETDNPNYDVFYKLRNVNTGDIKTGVTKNSVMERYAGRDMSSWETIYENRRKDANDLERDINGNREILKQRKVDLSKTKNSIPSGSTEIITHGFDKASRVLLDSQKHMQNEALEALGIIPKFQKEAELEKSQAFQAKSARVLNAFGVDINNMSSDEISERMTQEISGYNMNLGDKLVIAGRMKSKDPMIAKDFQDLVDSYDETDTDLNQVARGTKEVLTDVSNLPIIATLGAGLGFKTAIAETAKQAITRQAKLGAAEGLIYSGLDNAGKQSVELDAGKKDEFDFKELGISGLVGTAVGTLFGAGGQKLFGQKVKPKATNKLIQASKDKIKKEAEGQTKINIGAEVKEVIQEDASSSEIKPKEKKFVKFEKPKSKFKLEEEKKQVGVMPPVKKLSPSQKLGLSKKKDIIKPQKYNDSQNVTKSGLKFDSAEIKAGQDKVSDIDFEVVDPRKDSGKPLKGFERERRPPTIKRLSTSLGNEGRVGTADNSVDLHSKAGSGSKASLKIQKKKYAENVDLEVDKQMKIYDEKVKTESVYGSNQAVLTTPKEVPKDVAHYLREQQRAIEYRKLEKIAPSQKTKKSLYKKRMEIESTNVEPYRNYESMSSTVKKKYESQFEIKVDSKARGKRDIKLRQRYKDYTKNDRKIKFYKSAKELGAKLLDLSKDSKSRIIELNEELKLKERNNGKVFDYANPTAKQEREYPKQIREIQSEIDKLVDIRDVKSKKLNLSEAMYRAKRRIDAKIDSLGTLSAESGQNLIDKHIALEKEYEDIGLHQIHKDIEFDEPIIKKEGDDEYVPDLEFQKFKEAKEIKDSTKAHNSKVKTLEKNKNRKTPSVRADKARAGEDAVSKTEWNMLKEDILTSDEIANINVPITTNKDRVEAIKEAKKFASKKVNLTKRKSMGIVKDNIKLPAEIEFKDTVEDASNSMLQIMSVLFKNKSFAKYAGLLGQKGTIREELGELISEDIGRKVGKPEVKPVFMTDNYNQGRKGLVDGIMSHQKVSKIEAEKFLDSYYKHLNDLLPELAPLKKAVMKRMESGNPIFEWTLPDGFKVKIDLSRTDTASFGVKGKKIFAEFNSGQINNYSAALLPRVIQSIDGYLIRKINNAGIPGNHDSWLGRVDEASKIYKEGLAEINDSDLLSNILKDIGMEDFEIKKGTLDSKDIKASNFVSAIEHKAGEGLDAKDYAESIRKPDISRQLTNEEIMLDYAVSNSNIKLPAKQLENHYIEVAGYRDMGIPATGDNMMLRQLALAHNGNTFKKQHMIKAPKGVHQSIWDKTQKNLFNRFRAKLEYNPRTRKHLLGDLIYTDKNGNAIGSKDKTYVELLDDEIAIAKTLNTDELIFPDIKQRKDTKGTTIISYKEVQIKARKWEMQPVERLSVEQIETIKFVNEAKDGTPVVMTEKDRISLKTHMGDQFNPSDTSRAFDKFHIARKNAIDEPAIRAEAQKKHWASSLSEAEDVRWHKNIIETNIHAIRHHTEESAKAFLKKWNGVYKQAKPAIDQGALAVGDASQQIGAFLNNPKVIAKNYNLSEDYAGIIDQLISIKAMTPDSWKFLAKNKDSELFKEAMNTIGSNKKISAEEIFITNPEAMVTGFSSEFYDGNKQIVGSNIMFDAESRRESGVIPSSKDRQKVGTVSDSIEYQDKAFSSREEMIEFAKEKRCKITEKGMRLVANRGLREKAGKSNKFSDVITSTTYGIDDKLAHKKLYQTVLDELATENNPIISSTPKDGFRKLTAEESATIPWEINQRFKYVNTDYASQMMGRDEPRLFSKFINNEKAGATQTIKMIDRLWKESVNNMKQNIVIRNPSSAKNAFLYNQTIGASTTYNPVEMATYITDQKEAYIQLKTNKKYRDRIALLKAQGKNYIEFQKLLDESELYQMEQLGLAINKIDGIVNEGTLRDSMLSDATGGKLDYIANFFALNNKSKVGQKLAEVFSLFDTQGRYGIAKMFMNRGMDMDEAVQKSNDLFGNMNKMLPYWVDVLDKNGFAPFLGWFTNTLPGYVKLAKENPVASITTAIAMYALAKGTDSMLANINPAEANIDMADDFVSIDFFENIDKRGVVNAVKHKMTPYVIPKMYSELWEKKKDGNHNIMWKNRMKKSRLDFRGLTQKTIDDNLLSKKSSSYSPRKQIKKEIVEDNDIDRSIINPIEGLDVGLHLNSNLIGGVTLGAVDLSFADKKLLSNITKRINSIEDTVERKQLQSLYSEIKAMNNSIPSKRKDNSERKVLENKLKKIDDSKFEKLEKIMFSENVKISKEIMFSRENRAGNYKRDEAPVLKLLSKRDMSALVGMTMKTNLTSFIVLDKSIKTKSDLISMLSKANIQKHRKSSPNRNNWDKYLKILNKGD